MNMHEKFLLDVKQVNHTLLTFPVHDIYHTTFIEHKTNDYAALDITFIDYANHCFSYKKYEVSNPYQWHKITPSPRGIYPILLYAGTKDGVFRFDDLQNEFHHLNKQDFGEDFLVLVVDIGRLARIYGSFSIFLAYLELGHIVAETKAFFVNKEIQVEVHYHFSRIELREQLEIESDLLVGLKIHLKRLPYTQVKSINSYRSQKAYSNVADIHALSIDGYCKELETYEHPSYLNHTSKWPMTSLYRTSNHTQCGLLDYGIELSDKKLNSIIKFIQKILQDLQTNDLTVYMQYRKQQWMIKKDFFKQQKITQPQLLNIFSADKPNYYSFVGDSLTVLVCHRLKENHHNLDIFTPHVQAGEIIHMVSTCFSDQHTYTRPVKGFDNQMIIKELNFLKEEVPLYGLIVGGI